MSIDHAAPPQTAHATRHTAPAAGVGLVLRPARADEAPLLSELALRSKGWWGHSASFLLALSLGQAAKAVLVEVDGVVAGFHLLAPSSVGSDVGELDMLFVDPPFIGSGIGRILFEDARRSAAGRGWTRVQIEADPQARPFYERLGAV